MKKLLSVTILTTLLLTSTVLGFAANNVSKMATTNGGQQVAECAQNMDRGVSSCARR